MKNVALCILNKNEGSNLVNLINNIDFSEFGWVFAVDGQSIDSSIEVLNRNEVYTIVQEKRGRGYAIKLAIESAVSKDPKIDYLVLISSDGNEDPNDLYKIIELLPNYDLVIASRMLKDSWNEEDANFFKPRKYANNIFSYIAYFLLKSKNTTYITDPLNGLRGFSLKFVKSLELVSNEYAIEYEMSIKSYIHGSKVKEFPTIEHERHSGKSMVPPVKTVLQLLKILVEVLRLKNAKR